LPSRQLHQRSTVEAAERAELIDDGPLIVTEHVVHDLLSVVGVDVAPQTRLAVIRRRA